MATSCSLSDLRILFGLSPTPWDGLPEGIREQAAVHGAVAGTGAYVVGFQEPWSELPGFQLESRGVTFIFDRFQPGVDLGQLHLYKNGAVVGVRDSCDAVDQGRPFLEARNSHQWQVAFADRHFRASTGSAADLWPSFLAYERNFASTLWELREAQWPKIEGEAAGAELKPVRYNGLTVSPTNGIVEVALRNEDGWIEERSGSLPRFETFARQIQSRVGTLPPRLYIEEPPRVGEFDWSFVERVGGQSAGASRPITLPGLDLDAGPDERTVRALDRGTPE